MLGKAIGAVALGVLVGRGCSNKKLQRKAAAIRNVVLGRGVVYRMNLTGPVSVAAGSQNVLIAETTITPAPAPVGDQTWRLVKASA